MTMATQQFPKTLFPTITQKPFSKQMLKKSKRDFRKIKQMPLPLETPIQLLKEYGSSLSPEQLKIIVAEAKKNKELSNQIIERFVEGVEAQSQGKSIREMEKIRDECLVAIQKVLSKHNMGAGKTLNQFKKKIEIINKKS